MSVVKEQVELGVAIRMACLKIFCEWWKRNTLLTQI
jgi:aspartate carbamoyltransferase catalytic subunit